MSAPRLPALLLMAVLAACNGAPAEPLPDPFELRALLLARDYDALEGLLDSTRPEAELEVLYGAFASTDPALAAPLDAWVAARKESAIPPLARAYFNEHRGDVLQNSEGHNWRPSRHNDNRPYVGNGKLGPDTMLAINRDKDLTLAIGLALRTSAPGTLTPETLAAMLAHAPNSAAVNLAYLSNMYAWRSGDLEEVEAFLESHVRAAPNQSDMRALYGFPDYARARNDFSEDRYSDALIAIDKALSYGEIRRYRTLRAGLNWNMGRTLGALADYDRILARAPYDSDVLDWRSQLLYWYLDDPDAAYDGWDLAIRLDPLNPRILMHRADALFEDERYDEAMADLEDALAYDIGDPLLHHKRARILIYGLEDYRRALEETELSLSVPAAHNPVWAESWYSHGFALDQLADCRAAPAFERFLELCAAGATCEEDTLAHARARIAATGAGCPAE